MFVFVHSFFICLLILIASCFRATETSNLAPGGTDDGIVGGPRTPQQIAAQKRLQQTQAQVDEVSILLLIVTKRWREELRGGGQLVFNQCHSRNLCSYFPKFNEKYS